MHSCSPTAVPAHKSLNKIGTFACAILRTCSILHPFLRGLSHSVIPSTISDSLRQLSNADAPRRATSYDPKQGHLHPPANSLRPCRPRQHALVRRAGTGSPRMPGPRTLTSHHPRQPPWTSTSCPPSQPLSLQVAKCQEPTRTHVKTQQPLCHAPATQADAPRPEVVPEPPGGVLLSEAGGAYARAALQGRVRGGDRRPRRPQRRGMRPNPPNPAPVQRDRFLNPLEVGGATPVTPTNSGIATPQW